MHRMHRALGILPILVLALAACAAPGTGGGGAADRTTEPATGQPAETNAAPSGTAAAGIDDTAEADVDRVDIGVLAEDPAAFEGQPVAVLARVDEVLVDGLAFMTSPSGTEENQFPVVITSDAQVEKEIEVGNVLWLEGSPVAFTTDDLEAAGADVAADELAGFDGEFVFVATSIADPLAQAGDDGDS